MEERKFFIRELEMPKDAYGLEYITESELKRRLDIINGLVGPAERWIDILLYGEAKEPENLERDPLGLLDKRFGGGYVKEPPTDKWEEWVDKMPQFFMIDDLWQRENWQRWFRQMPR